MPLLTDAAIRKMHEVIQVPITGDLSAWAGGCELCDYGMLRPVPPLRRDRPLYQEREAQWRSGDLQPCTCRAGDALRTWLTGATQRSAQEAATAAALPQMLEQRRMARIFETAGVPDRYASYTIEGFVKLVGADPGKLAAIRAITQYRTEGKATADGADRTGILLYGAPGMGKTGSLAPLFTELVRKGASGLWVQYNELMADMRNFDDGHVDDRMHACQTVTHLFIDDFGDPSAQKTATDYARDVIFRIVDYRTSRNMPIFVTTNLTPDALQTQYDARIARRLLAACAVVPVTGKVLK